MDSFKAQNYNRAHKKSFCLNKIIISFNIVSIVHSSRFYLGKKKMNYNKILFNKRRIMKGKTKWYQ